jgi:predicted DNA-binding transcriptional regulator YafY
MEYNLRNLMDTESIVENEDGSAVITVTVNSLTEIASWIASRGKEVKVLEPNELKDRVVEIGKGILSNYS